MIEPVLQLDVFAMWDNFLVMTTLMILVVGGIALISKSLAVASYVAFLVFTRITIETGHQLLTNFLYVSLVMIMIGMAFKLWRLELGGDGG